MTDEQVNDILSEFMEPKPTHSENDSVCHSPGGWWQRANQYHGSARPWYRVFYPTHDRGALAQCEAKASLSDQLIDRYGERLVDEISRVEAGMPRTYFTAGVAAVVSRLIEPSIAARALADVLTKENDSGAKT